MSQQAPAPVVHLVPAQTTADYVHEGIVETLERYLEIARTRPLTGLCIFMVDDVNKTNWVESVSLSTTHHIGALARMQYSLMEGE